MTNQTPDSTKPSEREELIALARRCLWIAYCWNDHNFEPANTYARTEAEKLGIQSFEHANEWLDKAALLAEDKQVKVEQSERPYVDRGDAVNLARNVLEVERDKPLALRNPYTDTIEGQVRELEAYRYQGMPVYEVRALFTRPQQAAQVAQPLTDEQITKQFIHTEETENQFVNFERGVRFAEAAHGIGKDQAS